MQQSYGGDIDTQDDQFASYKCLVIVGPQIAFNMPKGFLNLTVGVSAGHTYAQAGSGASAPATITAPTPSGDTARTPSLGDPVTARPRPRPRPARVRPVPSSQNGATPDRASAAGGAR